MTAERTPVSRNSKLGALRMVGRAWITKFLLGLLILSLVQPGMNWAQDEAAIPDEIRKLIDQKTTLLQVFRQQNEAKQRKESLATLTQIVNIHRQAYAAAVERKVEEALRNQLRDVYVSDSLFLLDELYGSGAYAEAGKIGRDLQRHFTEQFDDKFPKVLDYKFFADQMEVLAKLSKDQQTAFQNTVGMENQLKALINEGKLEDAEKQLAIVLGTQTSLVGEKYPSMAKKFNQYGIVLWRLGKHAEAQANYLRAKKIREETMGRDLDYASMSFNLARAYESDNNFAAAEEQYLMATTIEVSFLGDTHPDHLETLGYLAECYRKSGQGEKLAQIEQKIGNASPMNLVLNHLPRPTAALVAVRPKSMADNPQLQELPLEVIDLIVKERLNLSPFQVEALVVFAVKPSFGYGFLFRMTPDAEAKFPWQEQGQSEIVTHASGQKYFKHRNDGNLGAVEFSDGCVLVGTLDVIEQSLTDAGPAKISQMVLQNQTNGQLYAVAELTGLSQLWQEVQGSLPPLPPNLDGLKVIPNDVETIEFSADLAQTFRLTLVCDAIDTAAAERTSQTLQGLIGFLKQTIAEEIGKNQEYANDSLQKAMYGYGQRMAETYLNRLQPQINQDKVTVNFQIDDGSLVGSFLFSASMIGMLEGAPKPGMAAAGNSNISDQNNLKMLGLAMHMYHDAMGKLPARANYAADGSPLLSWRVHLLPYLEQNELYKQFRLDEPWDSEHNLKLVEQMPEVFRSSQFDEPGKTVFLSLDGPGSMMEGKEGTRLAAVTDGLSNTLMIVEANLENAVIWTQPMDLPFDPQSPANGLGGLRPSGFYAAFGDGSVQKISIANSANLRNLIQRNDGQVIEQ